MNVADIQEGPDPLLHPSVRHWEPRPFDPVEYERWASTIGRVEREALDRVARAMTIVLSTPPERMAEWIDPGFRTSYLDELDRPRPWFRT